MHPNLEMTTRTIAIERYVVQSRGTIAPRTLRPRPNDAADETAVIFRRRRRDSAHAIDGKLVPETESAWGAAGWVTTHLLEHPSPRTRTHVEDRHLIPGSRRDDARF